MSADDEKRFETRGINHLAIVCKNMARTVHFYRDVLGFPLIKTVEVPADEPGLGGMQHFFFDIGSNSSLAFLWYHDTPEAAPGVASAPVGGGFSAHASMNHVAFDVAPEMLETYRQRLLDNGIEVSPIINHDDSRKTVSPEVNETTYVRGFYFTDPDGVRLEMAAWVRDMTPDDILIPPREDDSRPSKPAGGS